MKTTQDKKTSDAPTRIPWVTDLEEARTLAKERGVPIYIDFFHPT